MSHDFAPTKEEKTMLDALDVAQTKHKYPIYHDPRERMTEEQRQAELNNLDRDEATEDFADSPFADRV